MHEIYNQVLTYLIGMWRRRWWGALIAWVICVGGWVFVASMPDQFRSSARVYVDSQSMLGPLMRGLAVRSNVFAQIDFMNRTLLSRPNMEKVARMTDMDLSVSNKGEMDALVEKLRSSVSISSQGGNLFNISYRSADPELAKRVVQSLLTIFVESNLGASRKDLTSARRFIEEQIQQYERQLEAAENRMADFKRKNAEYLSNGSGYYTRFEQARSRLGQQKAALAEAVSRRNELVEQLKSVPQFLEVESEAMGLVAGAGPSSDTQVRILELEYQIEQALQKYTPKHPDVVAAQKLLDSMRKKLKAEEEMQAKAAEAGGESGASGRATKKVPNPLYEQVKLQLINAETQIAIAKQKISTAESEVTQLKDMADRIPRTEAELKRLDRDYGVIKSNYNKLLSRRESAKMAASLETNADQIQFRVVDPPQVPVKPSGPNRLLFLSAVLLAGIGAGVAMTFALSQIDDSIPNLLRLRASFALPVLGAVSAIVSTAQRRRQVLELSSFAMVAIGLFTAYGGLIAIEVLNFLKIS